MYNLVNMLRIFLKKHFTYCAGILQNCLQNLQKVDKFCELSQVMKEAQIKHAEHMGEGNKFQINKRNSGTKKQTKNLQ